MNRWLAASCAAASCAVFACTDETIAPAEEPTVAEGIFADLGEPLPSATDEQLATFERGREVALRRFSETTGLGPTFNVSFCGACHEKPVLSGSAGRYRNFLLVRQDLPDGTQVNTGVNGVQDQYALGESAYDPTQEETNRIAQRNPIPFFGVGLLAEIPDEVILANADPDDADGDGISGRANYDRGFVGRFGRKSQTVSLEGFIRGPLFNHAGITSDPLPNDRKNELPVPSGTPEVTGDARQGLGQARQAQAAAPDEPTVDDDGVPDPELSEDDLFDVVSFAMLVAAPRPDEPTDQTKRGEALFQEARCSACHIPALKGPRGLIPAYSDLLLHDMGDALADGIIMAEASGTEFRTQPLWGVAAVAPYLHDGRADTLDEAIRLHGGESEESRKAYEAFDDAQREDVLAFIASLGGSTQRSEGRLAPDAPVEAPLSYGGPDRPLSQAEADQFLRGRALFDRDQPITAGLGPRFNGDSCRACHFDPVIGGAGPQDVNVVRQGILVDGQFTTPEMGTMAHRHMLGDGRPPVDPQSNVFEARQTPSTLGLGLIDKIPEANILANADPDDLDGDGVRGVARVLPDGRVGRLGWKCGVPSLAEFARDASFNELGLTLPDQEGLTFGGSTDDDDISDPEMTTGDLEDLVFYLSHLAPPPRSSTDPVVESKGQDIFVRVGCASCHLPSLTDRDGYHVPLFSDLLLHDVAPPDAAGIEDGPATAQQFRTSPLWGLATSAPYMHDGRSPTIDDAIAAHFGEADPSVSAFVALSSGDRDALLSFLESL